MAQSIVHLDGLTCFSITLLLPINWFYSIIRVAAKEPMSMITFESNSMMPIHHRRRIAFGSILMLSMLVWPFASCHSLHKLSFNCATYNRAVPKFVRKRTRRQRQCEQRHISRNVYLYVIGVQFDLNSILFSSIKICLSFFLLFLFIFISAVADVECEDI